MSTVPLAGPAVRSSRPEHYDLMQGKVDPELGKTVEHLILSTDDIVVYLDSDLAVQWRTVDGHESPAYRGEILSHATILEAQSGFIEDRATLCGVRKLIAEAIAQCLDNQPRADALRLLREAEQQVEARNKEVSWRWYFSAAYKTAGLAILLFVFIWLLRDRLEARIGFTAVEVLLGGLCGPLGALLSATSRANRLVMDANAGERIHQFEGLSRVGVGVVGALFVALAIKGGLIMGGMQFSGSRLALLLALCVVAGASERLVPSLVTAFEKVAMPQDAQKVGE